MFESAAPRIFGLPPGADFTRQLLDGLEERLAGQPPEAMARVEIYVNTRRMQRRLRDLFDSGPARLLPRLRVITDLAQDAVAADLPPAAAPLRRRLELSQLVAQLLKATPDLAPRTALFDLSDSLAALMDEMQGEGVDPQVLGGLDVTDLSGHWARSLSFLTLVQRYFEDGEDAPDREARQRRVVERLVAKWETAPPAHPVIVAGSTGSRGATALFLQAVAKLPQGAVILPGYDFDMPLESWAALGEGGGTEDHPQYRFHALMTQLGLGPDDIARWTDNTPPCASRNKLISLSLRPAPVTDQWRDEGPLLQGLAEATEALTLVEAESPRAEAETIALRLRQAVDDGITAALITPDRMLTRQVSAALDRWEIVPDDSAGIPLPLSPPGRFLRQVGALFGQRLTAEALLSLLKHPLTHTGQADRGIHLLRTRELELCLRRCGPAFPDHLALMKWAEKTGKTDTGRMIWAGWIADWIDGLERIGTRALSAHLTAHLDLTERIAAGPSPDKTSQLWQEAAGRVARQTCDELLLHADAGGALSPRDYLALFNSVMNGAEVRDRDAGHPQILIWGTLEARVQGADLIILGGMNDGTWPESPKPDPWLNRTMRRNAGLLLPERRIGLSAHDYQQAVAGREVWITRAIRSQDAETVPSRWVNRLTNLLAGLPGQDGPVLLAGMRSRGRQWVRQAAALSRPDHTVAKAPRPSPRPPLDARPKTLSVTQIKTLIRDPYAVYARSVLGLKKLDPINPTADAPLRGTVLHRVLELFIKDGILPDAPGARSRLMEIALLVLEQDCPWPTVRRMWLARIARFADWFLATEVERQQIAKPIHYEVWGELALEGLGFILKGKADRIDMSEAGRAIIYDYKTGKPPSAKEQQFFDKQLLLEAAMVERGAFKEVGTAPVADAIYIGLGNPPAVVPAPLNKTPANQVWEEFGRLIARWQEVERGYTARMFVQRADRAGDFDHLARFGEWDMSTPIIGEDIA